MNKISVKGGDAVKNWKTIRDKNDGGAGGKGTVTSMKIQLP